MFLIITLLKSISHEVIWLFCYPFLMEIDNDMKLIDSK